MKRTRWGKERSGEDDGVEKVVDRVDG